MKRSHSNRSFVDKFSDVSMSGYNEGSSPRFKVSSNESFDFCGDNWCTQSKCSRASSHNTFSSASSDSSNTSRRSFHYFLNSSDYDREDQIRFSGNSSRCGGKSERQSFSHQHFRSDNKCSSRDAPHPRGNRSRHINHNSNVPSSTHHQSSVLQSRSPIFGVLPMSYWERSPGCKKAKLDHMDRMDHFCDDNREYLILQTTLWNRYITLERNMFPYDTPPDIEHWTLWCREELSHDEVCRYVERWLLRYKPHVRRWNYDDNSGDRSIDLFHVHVYIENISPCAHTRQSPPRDSDCDVNLAHLVKTSASAGETESSSGEACSEEDRSDSNT